MNEWLDQAACREHPTVDWWFPDHAHRIETELALAICRRCPVRSDCLTEILEVEGRGSRYGIAGGLTADQRQQLPKR